MILLHNNLKCIANFAQKKDTGARWATTGIQIESRNDGKDYAVAATDCKSLIVVEGPCAGDPADYPAFGALVNAPNGGTKALVPAKLFADTMAESAKNKSRYKPILNSVAVTMADAVPEVKVKDESGCEQVQTPGSAAQVVMGWTNLEQESSPKTLQMDGRFPPYRDIIPTKKPICRMVFDPEHFIRMGKALADLKPVLGADDHRAEFDFYGSEKPVIVRMKNENTGQLTTVLVMPMTADCKAYDGLMIPEDGLMDEGYWEKEALRFQKELASAVELSDKRYDLLTEAQSEIRKLKDDVNLKAFAEREGALTTLQEQNDELRRDVLGMSEELTRVRLELQAREADVEMYRERAESVKHAEMGAPLV